MSVAGDKPAMVGTPAYMSPELLERGEKGRANDVYGFGVLAWETMTLMSPWAGLSLAAIAHKVKSGARPTPIVKQPVRVGVLVGQCLLGEKLQRPSMSACVRQLEWALVELADDTAKAEMRGAIEAEFRSLYAELHSAQEDAHSETKDAEMLLRVTSLAVQLVQLGQGKGIPHHMVGSIAVEGKVDVTAAAVFAGRLRAGEPLDVTAITKQHSAAVADALLATQRQMQELNVHDETIQILAPGAVEECCDAACIAEYVSAALN